MTPSSPTTVVPAAGPDDTDPRPIGADSFWRTLVDDAADGYRGTDGHALRFARAKLGDDRVFRHLLEQGLIRPQAHVVDAGCGQGLLARLLCTAADAAEAGRWPDGWGAPPVGVRVTGIDPLGHDLHRAAAATGARATFLRADMREYDFPACDAVVFFDTLHYIGRDEQDAVLAKARAALRPGGALLLRVADASVRWRFELGQWIDRCTSLLHGGGFGRVGGRPLDGWRASLERLGLQVEATPMNGRPPFANLLIVARLAPGPAADPASAAPRDAGEAPAAGGGKHGEAAHFA